MDEVRGPQATFISSDAVHNELPHTVCMYARIQESYQVVQVP